MSRKIRASLPAIVWTLVAEAGLASFLGWLLLTRPLGAFYTALSWSGVVIGTLTVVAITFDALKRCRAP